MTKTKDMELKVSRILHAGYIFECDHTTIAFDPLFENPFSRNCNAYPNVTFDFQQIKEVKLDAIFISHYHDDHCSFESLAHLDRKTPVYMFCVFDEMFQMLSQLGFHNVYSLQLDKSIQIGSFKVTPRRALDADVDSIFHIQTENLNILNVVDSWLDLNTFEKLRETPNWDLILWPFQTMREIEVLSPKRVPGLAPEIPPEWIEQIQVLNPRVLIPSSCQFIFESWSWYNSHFFPLSYEFFRSKIQSVLPECHVKRLDPSQSFVIRKNSIQESDSLSWVRLADSLLVDYQYDSKSQPMSTADIARKFAPLTVEQTAIVVEYCKKTIAEKYKTLVEPDESYFKKTKFWRLSIYNHEGQPQNFYYSINKNTIVMTSEIAIEDLHWTTEIPIARFYGALQNGETLTSIYIRINDLQFNSTSEVEIISADPLDDPLIRCLFDGVFGSYQKAQLKKLNALATVNNNLE